MRVPVHKLCGMKRVFLRPGEETEVTVVIDPEQFEVIDENGVEIYEPGSFTIFAAGCKPDALSERLTGQKAARTQIEML